MGTNAALLQNKFTAGYPAATSFTLFQRSVPYSDVLADH